MDICLVERVMLIFQYWLISMIFRPFISLLQHCKCIHLENCSRIRIRFSDLELTNNFNVRSAFYLDQQCILYGIPWSNCPAVPPQLNDGTLAVLLSDGTPRPCQVLLLVPWEGRTTLDLCSRDFLTLAKLTVYQLCLWNGAFYNKMLIKGNF